MIARLLAGILTCVFLPMGIVFSLLGFATDTADAAGFRVAGPVLLAVGLALAGTFLVLRAREARRRARRRGGPRTTGQVVGSRYLPHVRFGSTVAYELTVDFVPAGTVSRMVLLEPGTRLEEGEAIQVSYDPDEPQNFEPHIAGLV